MDSLILRLISLFGSRWYTAPGLAAQLLLTVIVWVLLIDPWLQGSSLDFITRFGILLVLLFLSYVIRLYFLRKLPKHTGQKLGILICISCETERQRLLIEKDLVGELEKQFADPQFTNQVDVYAVKGPVATTCSELLSTGQKVGFKVTDHSDQTAIRCIRRLERLFKRTTCHFYVFGSFKERSDIEDKYILNLGGLIRHATLEQKGKKTIEQGINVSFPREVMFALNQERLGISVTAGSISLAVRYVTGIALLATNNPRGAIHFFDGLDLRINDVFHLIKGPPNIEVMRRSTRVLSAEAAARIAYDALSSGDVNEAEKWIDQSIALQPTYNAYIVASNFEFTAKKDPLSALKALHQAKKLARNDLTWLYNKAFLNFYMEKFQQGFRDYFRIRQASFPGEEHIVDQCIDFNLRLLETEPDKIQCHFILGFFQYFKLCNFPESLHQFELFMEKSGNHPKLKFLRARASEYLKVITEQMALT